MSALSTLFPKHGDEAKIIRCEIISTEEAQIQYDKANPKDIFEKCEDDYCPMPTLKPQEVSWLTTKKQLTKLSNKTKELNLKKQN